MHAEQQRKIDERREAVLGTVSSMSQLSLRDKAAGALSPRVREGKTSFGSSINCKKTHSRNKLLDPYHVRT